MSVTLRQILDLEVLQKAGVQVVAGADHLDRPVRWVHIGELADISTLLNGGELLLTTGMGIASSAAAQRQYVTSVADAGAAGLVIELGRTFDSMPTAMVTAACDRGFPLIALEHEARYVEVTELVHRAIINHQYDLLRQAEAISRDFTDLILGGASIRQIIARLAGILGNPVVLEDAAGHVVEFAGGDGTADAVLAAWEEHSLLAHTEVERGRVRPSDSDPQLPKCMWVGIWLRHEAWGRLHVLETSRTLDEITGLVLDRAGAALGLTLLSQKDAAHLTGRAGSALLSDVLAGRHGSMSEFLRRSRSLGVDLSRGRLLPLVVEATSLAELARRSSLAEEERQRIRLRMADEIRRAAKDRRCAALVGLDADRVLAIIAVTGPEPPHRILDDIVTAARRRISAADPSLTVLAGQAGRWRPARCAGRSKRRTEALEMGRKASDGLIVHHFGNLGTYQLLVRLAEDPELSRFIDSELGQLLAHDARGRTKLLPTLRCYLDNAGRKAETVRALQVQRRTLYTRLDRIKEIIGRDLDSQDTRTRLTVALQGLDLLHERAAGRGSAWTDE